MAPAGRHRLPRPDRVSRGRRLAFPTARRRRWSWSSPWSDRGRRLPDTQVDGRQAAGRAPRSCRSSIGDGAPVSGSGPDCVFGKAITSRMFSSPASSATSRSMPKAKPGVGRGPVAERVEQEPELAPAASLRVDARAARRSRCWMSGAWIRTLPEPSSQPLAPGRRPGCAARSSERRSPRCRAGPGRRRGASVNGWWAEIGPPVLARSPRTAGSRRPRGSAGRPRCTGGRPSSRRSSPSTWRTVRPLVGHEQHQVARPRAPSAPTIAGLLGLGQELGDRRVEHGGALARPASTPGPWPRALGLVGQLVELRAGCVGARPGTRMPFTHGAWKALNSGGGEHRGQLDQLHAEAHVGLVGAEALLASCQVIRAERRAVARR